MSCACNFLKRKKKECEFNGTSMHLFDSSKIFFSTFLSKIMKNNRVTLGFDPLVARLLGHDPTPRPTCPVCACN